MSYSALEVLVLGFLINFSLGYADLNQEQIVGGTEAPPGEIKYAVSLETPEDNICGAGIIGDQFVLTAAHCVIDAQGNFRENRLTALAGSTKAKVDTEGKRVAVKTIYVLKEYKQANPNPETPYRPTADIAVLKLQEKLGLDTNPLLSKLELPTSDPSYVNENANITGYGYDSILVYEDPETHEKVEYGGTSTDKLRYATAKVVSNEDCAKSFDKPVLASHLCAAIIQQDPSTPAGACTGDSGSPLVYKGNLAIGVLSYSPRGCREDTAPAVYTRVAKYATFVKNAMDGVRTADMRVATWMTTHKNVFSTVNTVNALFMEM